MYLREVIMTKVVNKDKAVGAVANQITHVVLQYFAFQFTYVKKNNGARSRARTARSRSRIPARSHGWRCCLRTKSCSWS